MITSAEPTFRQLASRLASLIAGEQFEQALELLPAFREAVAEAQSLSPGDREKMLREAVTFLQVAITTTKVQQAHYNSDLKQLRQQRAYMESIPREPKEHEFDFSV